MVDANATIPLIDPLAQSVSNLVQVAKLLLGGVVGIYLINIGLNFYRIRKMEKIIGELREDIRSINARLARMEKPKRTS